MTKIRVAVNKPAGNLQRWEVEAMSQHAEFRYSVRIKTDDLAVLHCLRALSQFAQKTGNKRIPWGGYQGVGLGG